MKTPAKMLARYDGHCPICGRAIKARQSIRYLAGEPAAHWDCHERMLETVCPGYRDPADFAAARASERASWSAAVAAMPPPASSSRGRGRHHADCDAHIQGNPCTCHYEGQSE